jgi:arylformamidase
MGPTLSVSVLTFGNSMTAIYRGMDRAALDAAYDNAATVADSQAYRERWWKVSEVLRAAPAARRDLRYGPRPRATLDYFPGGAKDAPLFVFIHGGYWQRNEKERFSFTALGPLAHGINVAVPGYTLAPEVRLTDIVAEVRQALSFLTSHAGELGFDGGRMFVGGWSAGGHLTAAVADHPAVRGGISISGIFDLEPIRLGVLNEKLGLDAAEVAALSPLRNLPARSPPLRMFVGGDELPELRRQSEDYTTAAAAQDLPVSLATLAGRHHFSILDELAARDGAIAQALVEMVKAT